MNTIKNNFKFFKFIIVLIFFIIGTSLVSAGIQPLNCTRPTIGGSLDTWAFNLENCFSVMFSLNGALKNLSVLGDNLLPIINVTGQRIELLGNVSMTGASLTSIGAVNFTNNTYFNNTLFVVDGRVGIGTTTPSQKLVVVGNFIVNGTSIVRTTTDSINAFQVLDVNGGTPIFNVDTTNERIGIGTSSPIKELHLSGAVIPFRISDSDASTDQEVNAGYEIYRGDNLKRVGFVTFGSDSNDIFVMATDYPAGEIALRTGSNSEAIRIDSSQNVGIGTAFPINELTIQGSVTVFGSFNATSINTTELITTNLQDSDTTNFFDLTGCGTGATFTALDQTGAVTCSSISITESQITDLSHIIFTLENVSNYTQYRVIADINNTDYRFRNLNITQNATVFGNLTLINFSSCALETDANGLVQCGVDDTAGGASSNFQLANVTEYLGEADSNGTLIRDLNTSWIVANQFLTDTADWVDNATDYLGGVDVNASLIKIGNITQGFLEEFVGVHITFTLENVSNSTPFSQVQNHPDFSNFNLGNVSNETSPENMANADFTDFTCDGAGTCTLDANVCDSAEIATNAVKDDEVDYSAVTLADFTNDVGLTIFNLENVSNHSSFPLSNFQLGNVSNNTLVKGDNETIALWNISVDNIIPRFGDLNINITDGNLSIQVNRSIFFAGNNRKITANDSCVVIVGLTSELAIC